MKELYKKGGTQYDKKLDCKAFVQPVDVHCLCCLTQTTQIQRPDSKGMPSIKGAPKSCRLQPLNSLYSAELRNTKARASQILGSAVLPEGPRTPAKAQVFGMAKRTRRSARSAESCARSPWSRPCHALATRQRRSRQNVYLRAGGVAGIIGFALELGSAVDQHRQATGQA